MAASIKRVAWDACTWIALIQQEKIYESGKLVENRFALARAILTAAEKGNFEIVVSGLCLVEVCKHPKIKGASGDAIAAYFEHDYILLVPVDKTVGTHARNLMMAGHAGLKPQDAVHIATALVANVDELHTFDDRMLSLDGRLTKLDGTPLKICKPSFGGPGTPLFGPSSKPYIPPSIPDDRPSDSENLK